MTELAEAAPLSAVDLQNPSLRPPATPDKLACMAGGDSDPQSIIISKKNVDSDFRQNDDKVTITSYSWAEVAPLSAAGLFDKGCFLRKV